MVANKRVRLGDLSYTERLTLFDFIAQNKEKDNLLDLIYEKFKIRYNPSSLKYVKSISYLSSNPESIKRDNEIMKRWKVEENRANSFNYADLLGELANKQITPQEFSENTQSIKF